MLLKKLSANQSVYMKILGMIVEWELFAYEMFFVRNLNGSENKNLIT